MLAQLGTVATVPLWNWAAAAAEQSPLANAVGELARQHGIQPDGPGLAVSVHQPGKRPFTHTVGMANLETKAPITNQTLFELASVSKTMTATAILILHDRGQLHIDDDVRKYLPELPDYSQGQPIRIQNLLQHTSGLASYLDFENVPAKHKTYWINDDYVGEFARQKIPLDFPTGQRYQYNNSNYMLLAAIVGRVTKHPFEVWVSRTMFAKAGMSTAFVNEQPSSVPPKLAPHCAVGYRKQKNKWRAAWGVPSEREETIFTVGDGSIWCSLDDMVAWDAAVRAGTFVKPATMQAALKPSKTHNGKTNNYGYGWSLYFNDDGTMKGYGHDGDWGGFHTSYYRYLTADRTTIILSNRGSFDTDKFWDDLNGVLEKHRFGAG